MERSIEPKISTEVMPTAMTSSAALSRSMLVMFVVPRKLGCMPLKISASTTMDTTLI